MGVRLGGSSLGFVHKVVDSNDLLDQSLFLASDARSLESRPRTRRREDVQEERLSREIVLDFDRDSSSRRALSRRRDAGRLLVEYRYRRYSDHLPTKMLSCAGQSEKNEESESVSSIAKSARSSRE